MPLATDIPVAMAQSGDVLSIDTVSHEGLLEDQGGDPARFFGAQGVAPDDVLEDAIRIARDMQRPKGFGPHVITGPIRVEGCKVGDYLAVDVLHLAPRVPYGIISNRHGRGVLPGCYPVGGRTVSVFARRVVSEGIAYGVMRRSGGDAIDAYLCARGGAAPERLPELSDPDVIRFPLSPFLGIMGVTPAGNHRLNTVPPSDFGGNLDIRLLVEGTRVYLPVFVDGAGFYIGDPHFSQGNGEVSLTAFEASLSAELRLTVIPRERFLSRCGGLRGPLVETPQVIAPTGRGDSLDAALRCCTREAIELLTSLTHMDERHAYAYLSAAADFDISEAVDMQQGVHGVIRKSDLGLCGGLFPEL